MPADLKRARKLIASIESNNGVANLSGLKLTSQDLKNLLAELQKTAHLKVLDISNNRLDTLPNEIKELKNLEVLLADQNRLTTIPRAIGELTGLKKLCLSKNFIYKLPVEIGELRMMEQLDLSFNKLTDLPSEIENLSRMKDLYINNNRLSAATISWLSEIARIRSMRRQEVLPLENLPDHNNQQELVITIKTMITAFTVVLAALPVIGFYCGLPSFASAAIYASLVVPIVAVAAILGLGALISDDLDIGLRQSLGPALQIIRDLMERRGIEQSAARALRQISLLDSEKILQDIFGKDQVFQQIEALNLGYSRVEFGNFVRPHFIEFSAKDVLKMFCNKIGKPDKNILSTIYIPTLKEKLAPLFDPAVPPEDKKTLIQEFATACGDCGTPVLDFIMQNWIGQALGKAPYEKQDAQTQRLIENEMLERKIARLPELSGNVPEKAEKVAALIRAVNNPKTPFCIMDGKEMFISDSRPPIDVPSKSIYFQSFKTIPKELAMQFIATFCQKDETGNAIMKDHNHYILDLENVNNIREDELESLGFFTERSKHISQLLQEYEKESPALLDEIVLMTEHFEKQNVKQLLESKSNAYELKNKLRSADANDFENVYARYVQTTKEEIDAVVAQYKTSDLQKMLQPSVSSELKKEMQIQQPKQHANTSVIVKRR